MTDLYSDYSNIQGQPHLDSDYWQSRNSRAEKQESYNLFDNLIKTNFDIESIKNLSLFNSKK